MADESKEFQLPSKEQFQSRYIAELEYKLDTCGLQCSATMKSLLAEVEQLKQDLRRAESARVAILAENEHYKQKAADLERQLEQARADYHHELAKQRAAQPPGVVRPEEC